MNSSYKERSNIAFQLHQSGDVNGAKKLYQELLSERPDDVNILNLFGLLNISIGDYDEAINLLSKATILNKSAYVLSNLAKAYYMTNDFDNSIKLYQNALEYEKSDDIYYSLALAYKKLNLFNESVNSYLKCLELNPANTSALYNLALIYKELKDYDNSLKYALISLNFNDKDVDVYTLISGLYEEKNDLYSAIEYLCKATFIDNTNYVLFYNLGVLYSRISDIPKSIECYKNALRLNPEHVESLVNIASQCKKTDKNLALEYIKIAYSIAPNEENVSLLLSQIYRELFDNAQSIKILKKLLEYNPSCAEAYSLLAINYMDLEKYDIALKYYEAALEIEPKSLGYMHGKASALKYLGLKKESQKILEYIVSQDDSIIQSVITLGMSYLVEKKFDKGMQLYTKRSLDTKFSKIFNHKIWNKGVDLKNKTVLLYSDCGLGDTIMFARYIPILASIAGKVIIQTDKELVSILKDNYKNVRIISKAEKVLEYDVVIPIMNIAYALDLDFDNIPCSDLYLKTDETLVEKYRKLDIFNNKKLKVGIFYSGNKNVFRNRFLTFNEISKLFDCKNTIFYSFQIENKSLNIENCIELSPFINDYSDTAALLKCIDVLVTVDSSIAHMAGALGVKTYLMLPNTSEWRWFDDNEKSLWYKSIRIFKQNKPAVWTDVIDNIKLELTNAIK